MKYFILYLVTALNIYAYAQETKTPVKTDEKNSVNAATANSQVYGLLLIVKGAVKIKKSNSNIIDAKIGLKVFPSETILTGKDSRAKIVMTDRNIINVLPDTELVIEKYTTGTPDKNVSLNLLEGKIRNNVEAKYDGVKEKFEVKTPTAIAGVRGTQFITAFDKVNRITQIITLKGEVGFANLMGAGQKSEMKPVKKGETSTQKEGAEPTVPKKLSSAELNKIESETVVNKNSPEPVVAPSADATGAAPSSSSQASDPQSTEDGSASSTTDSSSSDNTSPSTTDSTASEPMTNPVDAIISDTANIINDTQKEITNSPAKVNVVPE